MNTKIRSRSDEKGFGSDDDDRSTEVPNDLLVTTGKKEHSVLEKKVREENEENKQCCKQKDKAACSSLASVYAAVFLDIIGMTLAMPVLPYLVKSIAPSTEVFPQLGLENFWVGIPFAIYFVAHGVGSAVLGRISDVIGRRPSILISVAGSSIGFFIVGASCYTKSYAMLIFGRVVSGGSGFSMVIAKAYIADVIDAANQAAYLGHLGIFYASSMLFGPVIAIGIMFLARAAGSTKESEWASVFFVGAGLGVCAFVMAAFTLKESKPNLQPCKCTLVKKSSEDGSESSRSDIVDDNKDPTLQTEVRQTNKLVLAFLYMSVFAVDWPLVTLQTMYPLLIQYFWGWGSMHFGIILAAIVVPTILVQGFLVPVITKKYGERWMTTVGMMLMGVFGTYALFSGTGYERLENHHNISSWVGQKECVALQDGGEWMTGNHAFDLVVKELGTDGYSNLTAGLCAQLCLGYSNQPQLIRPQLKPKGQSQQNTGQPQPKGQSQQNTGRPQLKHNGQQPLQPNGQPKGQPNQMKFSELERNGQPRPEPNHASTEGMLVVGYWNTVSKSRVKSRNVTKTPVQCTRVAFSPATANRRAYCAWLHPELIGSVAPSFGPANPPLCKDGFSGFRNDTHLADDIYRVGNHHILWMVIHFVCITFHVIGWALSRIGLDALVTINSAHKVVGFTQGLSSSATDVTKALSLAISALLMELQMDYSSRHFGNFSFPFLLGAALALVCCWMPLVREGPRRKSH